MSQTDDLQGDQTRLQTSNFDACGCLVWWTVGVGLFGFIIVTYLLQYGAFGQVYASIDLKDGRISAVEYQDSINWFKSIQYGALIAWLFIWISGVVTIVLVGRRAKS